MEFVKRVLEFHTEICKKRRIGFWDQTTPQKVGLVALLYFYENGIRFNCRISNKPNKSGFHSELKTGIFINFREIPTKLSIIGIDDELNTKELYDEIHNPAYNITYRKLKKNNSIGFFHKNTSFMIGDSNKYIMTLAEIIKNPKHYEPYSNGIDSYAFFKFNTSIVDKLGEYARSINVGNEIDKIDLKYKSGTLAKRLFDFCKDTEVNQVSISAESLVGSMGNIKELEKLTKFFKKKENGYLIRHINQEEIDEFNNIMKLHIVNNS